MRACFAKNNPCAGSSFALYLRTYIAFVNDIYFFLTISHVTANSKIKKGEG
ncbi:MAG: hypothetical protein QWI73_02545 [Alphaproteobacteria bacterium]|nr:hypothetical protein [Alphaproteobacteria bacterium]